MLLRQRRRRRPEVGEVGVEVHQIDQHACSIIPAVDPIHVRQKDTRMMMPTMTALSGWRTAEEGAIAEAEAARAVERDDRRPPLHHGHQHVFVVVGKHRVDTVQPCVQEDGVTLELQLATKTASQTALVSNIVSAHSLLPPCAAVCHRRTM